MPMRSTKKNFKEYKLLHEACKNADGFYGLSDLGFNPSGFLTSTIGRYLVENYTVVKENGKWWASKEVAIAFAITRDAENLKCLDIYEV